MTAQAWDFGGYWAVVLGDKRSAADVAIEFDLDTSDRRGLDEWLGHAEEAAWSEDHSHEAGADLPEEWSEFHARALDALHSVDAA
jgi:hypothetical protein